MSQKVISINNTDEESLKSVTSDINERLRVKLEKGNTDIEETITFVPENLNDSSADENGSAQNGNVEINGNNVT